MTDQAAFVVCEKLESVLKIASHPQRTSEHAVLDRLFYKNNSQHRRAPYFRRVDHVRRALSKTARHRAWNAIRKGADSSSPLAFSTVAIDDIDELVGIVNNVAVEIIPSAATSLVVELLCRGHFTPFCVTIIASLSRLYLVERKLVVSLSAALSSMRVALAIDCNVDLSGIGNESRMHGSCNEDLGVPLSSSPPRSSGKDSDHMKVPSLPSLLPSTNPDSPSHSKAGNKPSLYDLMMNIDPESSVVAEKIVKEPFSVPRAAQDVPFGRPSPALAQSVGDTSKQETSCENAGVAQNQKNHCAQPAKAGSHDISSMPYEPSGRDYGIHMGVESAAENPLKCGAVVDEDEEDIDDIFGDL